MSEKLTPEEVARLDPFGVRKIPASEELGELLKEEKNALKSPEFKPRWKSGTVILHYEGMHSWCPHLEGVLVAKIDVDKSGLTVARIFLNGQKLLYETSNKEDNQWGPHPEGFVVRRGNEENSQFLLNGQKLLYKGEYDGWDSQYSRGIVINKGNRLLLNGRKLLYEGEFEGWRSHPQGVVIEKGGQFLLNGKELLYEGEWNSWFSHPEGVVIRKGNQFLLNGQKLLYQGEWNSWFSHPEGVIIRKGSDWIFYGEES